MPRNNRCMCMAHVCFYFCCSDCVGVCGNACVAAIVKNSVFSLGVLKLLLLLFATARSVVKSVKVPVVEVV